MFKKNNSPLKKISLVKGGGNKLKNKFNVNKRNPLYGLKNKIDLLESMLKEANLSQNDNYSEWLSISNNQSKNVYPENNY